MIDKETAFSLYRSAREGFDEFRKRIPVIVQEEAWTFYGKSFAEVWKKELPMFPLSNSTYRALFVTILIDAGIDQGTIYTLLSGATTINQQYVSSVARKHQAGIPVDKMSVVPTDRKPQQPRIVFHVPDEQLKIAFMKKVPESQHREEVLTTLLRDYIEDRPRRDGVSWMDSEDVFLSVEPDNQIAALVLGRTVDSVRVRRNLLARR